MKRVLHPELKEKNNKVQIDRNLYNANIKLLDENIFLKDDNQRLLTKHEKIKEYINSDEFKNHNHYEIKEELERIIEGIFYE